MKYRILRYETEEFTQYRAQYKAYGLFWRDCELVDYGHYCSEWRPRHYTCKGQARDAIYKHARERVQIDEPNVKWVVAEAGETSAEQPPETGHPMLCGCEKCR